IRLLLSSYVPESVKFIEPIHTSELSITANLLCIKPWRRSPSTGMPASSKACGSERSRLSLSMTTRTRTPRSCACKSSSRMLFKLKLYTATSTVRRAASIAAASGPSGPPVFCEANGLEGFVKYNSNHAPSTPYPAPSGISVKPEAGVPVKGGDDGVVGVLVTGGEIVVQADNVHARRIKMKKSRFM